MNEIDSSEFGLGMQVGENAEQHTDTQPVDASSISMTELIMKKSKSNAEYRKYSELASMLTLAYYKRLGSIANAMSIVYSLVNEATDVNQLAQHYNMLLKDESNSKEKGTEQARAKIANTLINDYRKKFGDKKADAYNTLVLQSWIGKVENLHDLVILMDNILTIREKLGNSWDYELHVIPMFIDRAYTSEILADFSTSTTNLVIGLSRKLKDNYLAVMTSVKILEFSNSPKTVKKYIRDMINENRKEIAQLNNELAAISMNRLSRMSKIMRIREINSRIARLNANIEEMMNGIDPKELMLESTKR